MKPITKQLIIGAFILTLVTLVSLGIRQVRFGANRAKTVESPVIAETEPDPLSAKSDTVDPEPEPRYAGVPEPDEQVPSEDYSEAKPSKGDHAKARGSKGGLEKISWGDNENLYITGKGETWYVGKGPDGKITKMRVEIDGTTGEITAVERADKSGAPQAIPIGDGYNMYVTEEGQTWYVGGGSKSRVEVDENTGEITVLEQYGAEDGK
ncbi:MAG: hypothetical protein ISS70_17500 [Phycisphaerae bacterium]|nr:hypothetical protein [Phycisphaerae bacterium]